MKQEEVWDVIAEKWARFRVYPTNEVSDFLKKKEGKVLDLGCGSGRNFFEILGLDFYGVDFSGEMVRLAKKKRYVEVKKGDACYVDYSDGFFDFVVFSAVLHCVEGEEKRLRILKECYRVLKNKGKMLVSVWGRGSGRVKNRDKESFVPWNVQGERFERYTYLYNVEELLGNLREVGFEVLSVEDGENIVVIVEKR